MCLGSSGGGFPPGGLIPPPHNQIPPLHLQAEPLQSIPQESWLQPGAAGAHLGLLEQEGGRGASRVWQLGWRGGGCGRAPAWACPG